jgi:TPR repeat protein
MRTSLVLGVVLACVFCFSAASPAAAQAQQPSGDVATLTTECGQKNFASCTALGEKYEKATGVTQNYAKALELYKQACDGGFAAGCGMQANMYASGSGVTVDNNKAAELYQKACEGGFGLACANLAYQYDEGEGVPKDWNRATELYQKACAAGVASACSNYLGPNLQASCGVSKNGFSGMYRALDSYDVVGKKAVSVVEDGLKKSEKFASGCEEYHYLWGQVYALKRDWAKMEESYRSGLAVNGRSGYRFANSLGDSMTLAASPNGNTEKMFEKLHTLTPPVPADLQKWFDRLVQAGLEKWKDDKEILKLRERMPKP